MPGHTSKRPLTMLTVALLLLVAAPAYGGGVDREDGLVVFNSDVHVQGEFGLLENPDQFTDPSAPLYNVAGSSLDLTWGEWSGASATATTIQHGAATKSTTDVMLRFQGLVPNGVYSLAYITFGPDSRNPECPTGERGIPLTALRSEMQEPDPSSFVADSTGAASYHARVNGALLDADRLDYLLIYHFDGNTYHPTFNHGENVTKDDAQCRPSYGADAMRQLIILQSGLR
jgi:hypothetical protein